MLSANSILSRSAGPAFLSAFLLAGCSAPGGYQSAEYRLPEGSTIALQETLELAPNSARVFIQNGTALRGDEVSRWDPFCSFGLDRTRDGRPLAREIRPTRFSTGETQIGVDAAMKTSPYPRVAFNGDAGGVLVASGGVGGGGMSAGTPWPYTYYTEIKLYSEDAPQVDDLTCSFDAGPVDRNLTVAEIQGTLGDLARIY